MQAVERAVYLLIFMLCAQQAQWRGGLPGSLAALWFSLWWDLTLLHSAPAPHHRISSQSFGIGGFIEPGSCWWVGEGSPFSTKGGMGALLAMHRAWGWGSVSTHMTAHEAEVSLCLPVLREGDQAWDEKWAQEYPHPLDRDLPVLVASQDQHLSGTGPAPHGTLP